MSSIYIDYSMLHCGIHFGEAEKISEAVFILASEIYTYAALVHRKKGESIGSDSPFCALI